MRKIAITLAAASTLLLSGCLFPEKFKARVDVNPDASYQVKFDGTVAHVAAVMKMVSSKAPLTDKDDAQMRQEVDKMSKAKGAKKVSYIGNGRFKLEVDDSRPAGASMNLFDVFSISTDKQGIMTFTSPPFTEKDRKELSKLGLSIDGTLEITLPKNAEVISSNATSTPKLFGLFGTYGWKIGDIQTRPVMKVRFK